MIQLWLNHGIFWQGYVLKGEKNRLNAQVALNGSTMTELWDVCTFIYFSWKAKQ